MTRQDTNEAFCSTSFLYGGNAAYIEDLYARYEEDPASVDADWRELLRARSRTTGATSSKNADGAVLEAAELAGRRQRRAGLGARRQLGAGREGRRRQDPGQGRRRRASTSPPGRGAAGDARLRPRHHDDPRLPHARPSARRSRSARPRAARADARGAAIPSTYGFTEADCDRQIFIDNVLGLEFATIREMLAILRAHLLLDARRRVHAHLRPGEKAWIQERIEGPDKEITFTPRGQAGDPQQAGRGRGLREVPRRQVHRHQALRPRRRRVADPGARADHQARRRARREGDRARHGPSRPPQRARPR